MYTTFGAPSGALGGSNGVQSGSESRMSTLIVPLKGSPTMHPFCSPGRTGPRAPRRSTRRVSHNRAPEHHSRGVMLAQVTGTGKRRRRGVTSPPPSPGRGSHGGELVLDAAQQLMIGIAERADALALQLGGHGAQVE